MNRATIAATLMSASNTLLVRWISSLPWVWRVSLKPSVLLKVICVKCLRCHVLLDCSRSRLRGSAVWRSDRVFFHRNRACCPPLPATTAQTTAMASSSQKQSSSKYVTLISSDGFEFVVLREAACVSKAIQKMLAGELHIPHTQDIATNANRQEVS